MKKEYNAPVVDKLGSAAEQTKGGANTGSDSEPFRQNSGGLPPGDISPRSS